MSLRFFADHCIPNFIIQMLRNAGHVKYKGIIALQVRNHPEIIPKLMKRLKDYLSTHNDMNYYKGKLFLVEVHRIRIRE